MNFPSHAKDWEKNEKNNKSIALSLFFHSGKKERNEKSIQFKTQFNARQVNSIALPFCKRFTGLLRKITSNHDGVYYCMICLYSFETKDELKPHENMCENHDHCHMVMPEEGKNILKYNQDKKSLKTPSSNKNAKNFCKVKYLQNQLKLLTESNKYEYCLSKKLKNSMTSAKIYWSISKVLLNSNNKNEFLVYLLFFMRTSIQLILKREQNCLIVFCKYVFYKK